MENEKIMCPECGSQMIESYVKPALNLKCPKCGCELATTRWEEIDLDETKYEIYLLPGNEVTMDNLKHISKITCNNFIKCNNQLVNGALIFSGSANDVKQIKADLDKLLIKYSIKPDFKY